MSDLQKKPDQPENEQSEILVNQYGETKDSAVVIEEADRTVLLTEDETIIFEKQPQIDIAPANRPRKVYAGMWGTPEIAAVGAASLTVLATLLFYFFVVLPSNKELEKNRADSDRLQKELTSAREKFGNMTSTEARVGELISSVNDFELNNLSPGEVGKNTLYQKINGLIGAFGLVNTTGPDYVPLEMADQNPGQQTEEERGRAKFRSLFPGVYVTMTLEGSYQNLRRFINEIERGRDFIVISAIELEPSDSESHKTDTTVATTGQPVMIPPVRSVPPTAVRPGTNLPPGFGGIVSVPPSGRQPMQVPGLQSARSQPYGYPQVQQQAPAAPKGKTHGETVSLRLELAAYFRRVDFTPMESLPEPRTMKGGVQ